MMRNLLLFLGNGIQSTKCERNKLVPSKEWWGYVVRYEVTKEFLRGNGLEIGPGASPQMLPEGATAICFDKRDSAGLAQITKENIDFPVYPMTAITEQYPNGADFVIAHQVLEHTADPIRALLEWHSYVRDGGTVVLSMPDWEYAYADKLRAEASFEHVLLDYLLDRGETSVESREHVLSFSVAWHNTVPQPQWTGLDSVGFAGALCKGLNRDGHDCHWHALSAATWKKIIQTAAVLAGCKVEFQLALNKMGTGKFLPDGEIIFVYKLSAGKNSDPDFTSELREQGEKLAAAGSRILDLIK